MITLSFSTINNCLQPENSHNWLNKMMGYKPEDKWYYHAGKEAHDIVQRHVSGVEKHPHLKHIKEVFPIVETRDFDPACMFEFNFNKALEKNELTPTDLEQEYHVIGFYDGRDNLYTKFLEIKSSSNPWSLMKFQKSFQRKIYVLSNENIKNCYLITGQKEPEKWKKDPPKTYSVPATKKDKIDALAYIYDAVRVIQSGEFKGGLDENGKCTDPYCYFGCNCQFK